MSRRARRRLQIGTAALTGTIALSAYAGVVGLVGRWRCAPFQIVIIVDASYKALRRSRFRELALASVGKTSGGRR